MEAATAAVEGAATTGSRASSPIVVATPRARSRMAEVRDDRRMVTAMVIVVARFCSVVLVREPASLSQAFSSIPSCW